jgi:hypothetical protein
LAERAVMVTGVGEADTPVTRPEALTVATAAFDDRQVKVVGAALPFASRPTAASWTVAPTLTVAVAGATVTETTGPTSGALTALLRGAGAATVKSAALSSVSCRPSNRRRAAVVLVSAGVGPVPSKQLAAP